MYRVTRYRPRKIHFEDLDSGVLESERNEALELEQYPSLEEEISPRSEFLNQEEMQSGDCSQEVLPSPGTPSLELKIPPPSISGGRERPRKTESTNTPLKRKRGRPRKTESAKNSEPSITSVIRKLPLSKPFEVEIERIKNNKRSTPLTKMVQMRLKGLSVKEIADKLGMKYNTVLVTMRNLFELLDREKLIAFEKYRNEIYSAIEFELLDLMLDPEKKAEAKLQNVAYAFDRIYNARRLEQGKSTANVGLHVLIEEMERRREKQFPEMIKEENSTTEVLPSSSVEHL